MRVGVKIAEDHGDVGYSIVDRGTGRCLILLYDTVGSDVQFVRRNDMPPRSSLIGYHPREIPDSEFNGLYERVPEEFPLFGFEFDLSETPALKVLIEEGKERYIRRAVSRFYKSLGE